MVDKKRNTPSRDRKHSANFGSADSSSSKTSDSSISRTADSSSSKTTDSTANNCDLEELKRITSTQTVKASVPLATEIQQQIPVYCGDAIARQIDDIAYEQSLLAEWNQVFDQGAGIVVIKAAFPDTDAVQEATDVLQQVIDSEAADTQPAGDHFAAAGANSRLWNAHEKLAVANASVFARYYANPVIHLACRAWLGPAYQITAQVNVVHPGGTAQICHRDYHLGFQSIDQLGQFPPNVHRLSPHLTLQAAIAHSPMPISSGPTQLLPYSQKYHEGYFATQLEEFRDYFATHHVQLPLETGDAVFFNPAVFHAAGENKTDDDRFANLLQIGSAFGRTTEIVDRTRLCRLVYPVLHGALNAGTFTDREINDVVAATAEGYAFPCNLDLTPPVGGMAPASQQAIMHKSLKNNASVDEFNATLDTWLSLQRS